MTLILLIGLPIVYAVGILTLIALVFKSEELRNVLLPDESGWSMFAFVCYCYVWPLTLVLTPVIWCISKIIRKLKEIE